MRAKYRKIIENGEIIRNALLLKNHNILIIADLHLGIEEMYNAQGIFIPRINFEKIMEDLEYIFDKINNVKTIVINGDLKHEFGIISEQEWKEVTNVLSYLQKKASEIIIVKGNHNNIIGPIARFNKVKLMDQLYIENEDILIVHGHEIKEDEYFNRAKTIIIAHEHAAISLKEFEKIETYKCFLKGIFREKTLIVMPSLCAISEGTNILREKLLSPFLEQDLGNFECWLIADKVYYFGRIKGIL